jgi:hypothetical protein
MLHRQFFQAIVECAVRNRGEVFRNAASHAPSHDICTYEMPSEIRWRLARYANIGVG